MEKETSKNGETSKKGETSKPRKPKQKYKIRDVIQRVYRERIEELIPVEKSDKDFIGHYQRAVSTVQESLTSEEMEEVEAKMETWNTEGLPQDVQLK